MDANNSNRIHGLNAKTATTWADIMYLPTLKQVEERKTSIGKQRPLTKQFTFYIQTGGLWRGHDILYLFWPINMQGIFPEIQI